MADTALRHLLRRGCQQVSPRRARRGRSLQDRTSDTTPNRLSRSRRCSVRRGDLDVSKSSAEPVVRPDGVTDDSRESRVSRSELELASLELLGAGPSPRFFTRSRATVCPDAPVRSGSGSDPWRKVRMEVAQSCAGWRVDACAQGDSARRSEVSHPHGQRGRTVYAHQGRAGYSSCLGRRGCDRP